MSDNIEFNLIGTENLDTNAGIANNIVTNGENDEENVQNPLKRWLNDIELSEYYDLFVEHGYSDRMSEIIKLNNDDLKHIGIGKIVHRKVILIKIELFR